MINLHIYSPIRFCKLILEDMVKVGRGKIINVSSIAAFTPGPFMAIYYATKGCILSFGQAISYELEGTGVSLTTVCPGLVKTSFATKRASLSGVTPPNYGYMADGAEKVARIAYNDMLKGNTVSIPVIKNRIMRFIMWLLPNSVVIKFIRKSQAQLNGI
jgi:short-subunit dehydrogenase